MGAIPRRKGAFLWEQISEAKRIGSDMLYVAMFDEVSPWTVGRYRDGEGVARHSEKYWQPDSVWCDERELDYLPVVFPGGHDASQERGARSCSRGCESVWACVCGDV